MQGLWELVAIHLFRNVDDSLLASLLQARPSENLLVPPPLRGELAMRSSSPWAWISLSATPLPRYDTSSVFPPASDDRHFRPILQPMPTRFIRTRTRRRSAHRRPALLILSILLKITTRTKRR